MAAGGTRSERVDRRTRAGREDPTTSREHLLAAAAKVFAERGFEGASVEQIAAEAGLSKGTLYWNFKSKDELFLALLEEHIGRRIEAIVELTASLSADQDLSQQASRWLSALLEDEPQVVLLAQEYWARAARDPVLKAVYAERLRSLGEALTRALDARRERLGAPVLPMPTEEVATAYIALADGLARRRLIDPDSVPDHLYGEILALVFQGLVARLERSAGDRPG
jgi:AcrR family transcriptional regulator